VNAGTEIAVRTNEEINTSSSDGAVFSGVVENDVRSRAGTIAIPRGSEVELVVKQINNGLVLDLDSVVIDGRRYGISTEGDVSAETRKGIGANKRTGKYVGGGAIIGGIIGAISGGGKGAAVGAGAGAAAGAGAQVLTRGKNIKVPAESLLTFRLTQPIQTPALDSGFNRNGRHYHNGYGDDTSSAAYQAGLRAGRSDAARGLRHNTQTSRWTARADRLDYQAGYNQGYDSDVDQTSQRFKPSSGSIMVRDDNNVTWNIPNGRIYVQVDNNPRQLFASGPSGTQPAPWIEPGHVYVFILEDLNGNEVARDRLDTRRNRRIR